MKRALLAIFVMLVPCASYAAAVMPLFYNVRKYPNPTFYSYKAQPPMRIKNLLPYNAKFPTGGDDFQTYITRISENDISFGTFAQEGNVIRNAYSKIQTFNANDTVVLIWSGDSDHGGGGGITFLKVNGKGSFDVMRSDPAGPNTISNIPSQANWSNKNPNLMWGTSGTQLLAYYPSSDKTTLVHDFTGTYTSINMGQGEASPSNDDHYVVLTGTLTSPARHAVFVYDLVANTSSATHIYTDSVDTIDWAGISQSGNYVAVKTARSTCPVNVAACFDIYNNSMTLIRTSNAYGSHADFCYDAFGNEVIVTQAKATTDLWTIRLSDDVQTRQEIGTTSGRIAAAVNNMHVSCRNINRPGWAYFSDFDDPVNVDGANPPQSYSYNEVYALRLDGSTMVERWVYSFMAANPTGNVWGDAYDRSTFAVPNRDGTKVIFGSDWGSTLAAPNDPIWAYVATMH